MQPVHPAELVGELLGVDRIAVGQVDAADPDHAALDREHALDQPRLLVGIVAGQAARHLVEAELGEDGDAVPALLAEGLDIVAQRLDLGAREALVDRLDLLQADDVGRCPASASVEQHALAGLDAVDVPGGDAHGSLLVARSWRLSRSA